jgi:hypothetical protein
MEYYIANNFKITEKLNKLPSSSFMSNPSVMLDVRNNMFCVDCDFCNWQWYYNYLETNAMLAYKAANKAYPAYLLGLGYVPIVFLPSCIIGKGTSMLNVLDSKGLPYIKTAAYSFTVSKPNMDTIDAWMSKLDIERIFGIPYDKVRSVDVVRRIYDTGI